MREDVSKRSDRATDSHVEKKILQLLTLLDFNSAVSQADKITVNAPNDLTLPKLVQTLVALNGFSHYRYGDAGKEVINKLGVALCSHFFNQIGNQGAINSFLSCLEKCGCNQITHVAPLWLLALDPPLEAKALATLCYRMTERQLERLEQNNHVK